MNTLCIKSGVSDCRGRFALSPFTARGLFWEGDAVLCHGDHPGAGAHAQPVCRLQGSEGEAVRALALSAGPAQSVLWSLFRCILSSSSSQPRWRLRLWASCRLHTLFWDLVSTPSRHCPSVPATVPGTAHALTQTFSWVNWRKAG